MVFNALPSPPVPCAGAPPPLSRYSAWVASQAHVAVMRHARPGMMEYELEAKFHYEIYSNGGCRKAAYTAICACGPNPAILHYGHSGAPNDRHINEGDLGLLDMGAEYHGYVSDITCSYPIRSGALGPGEFFTDAQKVRRFLPQYPPL